MAFSRAAPATHSEVPPPHSDAGSASSPRISWKRIAPSQPQGGGIRERACAPKHSPFPEPPRRHGLSTVYLPLSTFFGLFQIRPGDALFLHDLIETSPDRCPQLRNHYVSRFRLDRPYYTPTYPRGQIEKNPLPLFHSSTLPLYSQLSNRSRTSCESVWICFSRGSIKIANPINNNPITR